jgi:hypothetical protein
VELIKEAMPIFPCSLTLGRVYKDFIARTSFELWQVIFCLRPSYIRTMSKPPFLGTGDFPSSVLQVAELTLLKISLLKASSLIVDAVWVLEGVKVE